MRTAVVTAPGASTYVGANFRAPKAFTHCVRRSIPPLRKFNFATRMAASNAGPHKIAGSLPLDVRGEDLRLSLLLSHLGAWIAPAVVAAGLLLSPMPASADLVQTVPLSQITEAAKPLPKQTIDKGKVWIAFIGGAVILFLSTVALENNDAWFPAISKANKALSIAKSAQPQAPTEPPVVDTTVVELEAELEARQTQAVAEGLAAARKKVLGTPAAGGSDQQPLAVAPDSSSSSSGSSSAGSSGPEASLNPTSETGAAGPPSSSSSGASLAAAGGGSTSSAGYTVVTDSGNAEGAQPAAWAGGDAAAVAATAARLEGLMERQSVMKEYREQQAAQQAKQSQQ